MLLANMLPGCRTARLNVLKYGTPAQEERYESDASAEVDPEQTPHHLISFFQNERGKFELQLSFIGLGVEQVDTAQTLIDWNLHVFALLYPRNEEPPPPAPAPPPDLGALIQAPDPTSTSGYPKSAPARTPRAARMFVICIAIVGTAFGGWLTQPSDFHVVAAAVVGPASQDRISATTSRSRWELTSSNLHSAAAAGSLALELDTSLTPPTTVPATASASPKGGEQHRIFIELALQDSDLIRPGQLGVFTLISDPVTDFPFTLGEVQVSTRKVNGQTRQRISALVDDPQRQLVSKGGLSGHARIEASRQANAWVLWRNLRNYFGQ